MSQENVEIARRLYAAFNENDWEAIRDLTDPNATLRTAEGFAESGPFVGRESIIHWLELVRETWPDAAADLIGEVIDIGDRVVLRFRWGGAGAGPNVSFEVSEVITLLNGKIVARQFYWDHAEARKAVGLAE